VTMPWGPDMVARAFVPPDARGLCATARDGSLRLVIPAQAGIHLALDLLVVHRSRASTRPTAERVTFFACAKKVTKESTPRMVRPPGLLPSGFARALRRFADGTSLCRQRTGALPARHPAGFFLRALAAPYEAPFGGILPQKRRRKSSVSHQLASRQARDGRLRGSGAVRGAEHRRRRRIRPAGARAGGARVGCSTRMYCQPTPAAAEKRRGVGFARCESDHRVRCLAFLVTFWAMPKSNPLPRRGSGSSGFEGSKSKSQIKMDSGLRRNDEPKPKHRRGLRQDDEPGSATAFRRSRNDEHESGE
jgi:hypothetical protein